MDVKISPREEKSYFINTPLSMNLALTPLGIPHSARDLPRCFHLKVFDPSTRNCAIPY